MWKNNMNILCLVLLLSPAAMSASAQQSPSPVRIVPDSIWIRIFFHQLTGSQSVWGLRRFVQKNYSQEILN